MVIFLILLTVIAIFLFMTGTLRTVSSIVISLAVLLCVGLGLIFIAENAFKDPQAFLIISGFTLAICVFFFFGGRWLMLKHDPLQQPKEEKQPGFNQ